MRISYSRVNCFTQCPRKYSYRYEQKIETPVPHFFRRGRVVHEAQEYNYLQKLETRQDLPLDEILDFAAQGAEEDIRDETVALVKLYHEEIAPTIQPKVIEEKIEIPISNGTLVGVIDLVDERGIIHDTKTTGRKPSDNVFDTFLQGWIYSYLWREGYGEEESGISLDYLISTKIPKKKQISGVVDDWQRMEAISLVEIVAEQIQKGVDYPSYGFLCSGCEFKSICLGVK